MTSYEALRQRHVTDAAAMLPDLLNRLSWPTQRLAEHRVSGLRRLVRVAKNLSPWHRKRLSEVHPDEVDETNLAQLPVMTKDDLMMHFDEIVTDERLRLDVVDAHLEGLTTDAYLFDRYHACASGGSSGRRGVFIYDWDGWAVVHSSFRRHLARLIRLNPTLAAVPARQAVVGAASASHMSSSLMQTFSTPQAGTSCFPIILPMQEIVAGLNATQPTGLLGYPSALHLLTAEARAGGYGSHHCW